MSGRHESKVAGAGIGARLLAGALLIGFAGLAAGCVGTASSAGRGGPAALDVTNAPAVGFENMEPGSEEDFMLNVGRRTYFTQGSAELDETARVTLDKQAAWLNRYPAWKIKVQGFADDPGSEEANVALSARRAEAVLDYLASRGVARERMWSKGYGRERMVRDCAELACKSVNRRVISNLREEFES